MQGALGRRSTPGIGLRNAVKPLSRCSSRCRAGGFFGSGKDKEDAARKALESTFGKKGDKKAAGQGGAPDSSKDSGNFFSKIFGGGSSGGGDGGAGGKFNVAPDGGEGGGEKPIWQEISELLKGLWVFIWNCGLFLAFIDFLHRTLDSAVNVELLFLVGAPQQALELIASSFFNVVEWLQKNLLGWDIPEDEDMQPVYEETKLYWPEEHAIVFDQYRHKLSDEEKRTLRNYYALRHWERQGGFKGDVHPDDVAAIRAKYDPEEADLQAYRQARAQGKLEEYFSTRNAEELDKLAGLPEDVSTRALAQAARA